jgi:DNA-nicking Smr family endonuclease
MNHNSSDDRDQNHPDAVVVPIEDEIDLHTFRPGEAAEVLDAYFEACREEGILEVRVIHGKGTGKLRDRVWKYLNQSPHVADYELAGPGGGTWGATLVRLKPPNHREVRR